MRRDFLLATALCVFGIVGCDTNDLINSGSGHNARSISTVELDEADLAESIEGETAEQDDGVAETDGPPDDTGSNSPNTNPAGGSADNCGAGQYVFRTDSDGKKHFDARFEPGGVIRYNFTVQPNRGKWRISGNQMIFNGPFGAGHANHVSSWTITSRSSDCKVQRFQGKSFGGSDVTASRR